MSNRVNHFEIPADDPERAVTFYADAFGWKIEKWGGPQEYWLVDTGEGPGINGGIMRRGGPFQSVVNTITVDDLSSTLDRTGSLGAKLVGDRIKIPDVGDLQYAQDSEGNLFGMMQPVTAPTV
ncbi:MAG: VOC family protein [Vulcanimicrobiaceae bacterium]